MLTTSAPPSRLTVRFEGFHQDIPPLVVHVGGFAGDRVEVFRRRIRDHVVRYMYAHRRDDIRVTGNPDSPHGRVEVDAGGALATAGHFTVAVDQHPRSGASGGVPVWLVVAVIIAAVLLL